MSNITGCFHKILSTGVKFFFSEISAIVIFQYFERPALAECNIIVVSTNKSLLIYWVILSCFYKIPTKLFFFNISRQHVTSIMQRSCSSDFCKIESNGIVHSTK